MKLNLSFFTKNLLFSCLNILLIGLILMVASYFIQQKVMISTINEQAIGFSALSYTTLNELDIRTAIDSSDEDSRQRLSKQLSTISEINPNVSQAYLFEAKDLSGYMKVISAPIHIVNTGIRPGDNYMQPIEMTNAFHKMVQTKQTTTTDIYTDVFGTWISVLKPIYNDGDLVAWYGIDQDASMVGKGQKELLAWMSLVLTISLLIVYIVHLNLLKRIQSPIKKLFKGIQSVSQGNLNINLQTSRKDDVGELIKTFNLMVNSIRDTINQIEESHLRIQSNIEPQTNLGAMNHTLTDITLATKRLLEENNQYFKLVEEQNKWLQKHSEKIEEITLHEERNRIAGELHDTIGHTFTALIMGLQSIQEYLEPNRTQLIEKLNDLLHLTRTGYAGIRDQIHQLPSYEESQLSVQLTSIINDFSNQTDIDISFDIWGEEGEVMNEVKLTFIRCLQEALTNSLKHGGSSRIIVNLSFGQHHIHLQVQDNGKGQEQLQLGFGLTKMKERVELLQGTVDFYTNTGNGMIVSCSIPLHQKGSNQEIKVLLVDDQKLTVESLQRLLNLEEDLKVVGTAYNGDEALKLVKSLNPHLLLMDVNMAPMSGIEATKRIKENYPEIKIILLTSLNQTDYAIDAINFGADGYLLKNIHPKNLASSIRLVYNGGSLISKEMAQSIIHSIEKDSDITAPLLQDGISKGQLLYNLTDKEVEILKYVSNGLTGPQIAEVLFLSKNTVRNYLSVIYSKLNVENRMMMLKKIQEEQLID